MPQALAYTRSVGILRKVESRNRMLPFQLQQFGLGIPYHDTALEFVEHRPVVSAVPGYNNIVSIQFLKIYNKTDGIPFAGGCRDNIQVPSARPHYLAQSVTV